MLNYNPPGWSRHPYIPRISFFVKNGFNGKRALLFGTTSKPTSTASAVQHDITRRETVAAACAEEGVQVPLTSMTRRSNVPGLASS